MVSYLSLIYVETHFLNIKINTTLKDCVAIRQAT